MSERISSPKPRQIPRKVTAVVAASALALLAGCSGQSPERQAMENTTRQVFTELIAGKPVSKDPFGDNTFIISVKDKRPGTQPTLTDMQDAYATGEKRVSNALGLNIMSNTITTLELRTMATCDTAAVNKLITPEVLKDVQDRWDYYQQLGGQKELNKGGETNDAFRAILALGTTCMAPIGESMMTGADVTFVPASNE